MTIVSRTKLDLATILAARLIADRKVATPFPDQWSELLSLAQQAQTGRDEVGDRNHVRSAQARYERALLCLAAGQFDAADSLLQEAQQACEAVLSPGHPDLGKALLVQSLTRLVSGRPSDADEILNKMPSSGSVRASKHFPILMAFGVLCLRCTAGSNTPPESALRLAAADDTPVDGPISFSPLRLAVLREQLRF